MENIELSFNLPLSGKDIARGLRLPLSLSPELAYLSGILIGDGSICYREDRKDYVLSCVGNPRDEQPLYHMVIGPIFQRLFGFTPNFKLHNRKTTFGFTLHSKTLFRYFTEVLGLCHGKKEQQLGIPPIFRQSQSVIIPLIRGIFDTDGCISFKRKYRTEPYYPVINLSSKSKKLVTEVAAMLKELGFSVVETYDYRVPDERTKNGFTVINRIELNGQKNFRRWIEQIGFWSPKHLEKIKRSGKNSGGWI